MSDESLVVPNSPEMLTYNSYLKVFELIALQSPVSRPEEHDEMLFIIIHQVYELWFKQILHEVKAAETVLNQNNLMGFVRGLRRIASIQDVLVQQVNVLETMTPADFNRFRDNLNPASGFQSYQFRLAEILLGSKDTNYLKFYRTFPKALKELEVAIASPTLYDHFLRYLARRGIAIPQEVLERDVSKQYVMNEGVRSQFIDIYRDPKENVDVYLALESLVDLDQKFTLWRYRHVAMVERMIGNRRGTGGSSGVKYLSQTLEKRFFPELWDLRNYLGNGYGGK